MSGEGQEKREKRLAVVLFNLGGPDSLDAVEPFLKNLFLDPAILRVAGPIRALLARRIASKRAPTTREIYEQLGGKTPLLELTEKQAEALEKELKSADFCESVKVFIAMRYWHPRAGDVVAEVKDFDPSEVILLPLYPQFSTTTTGSSMDEWKEEAIAQKLIVPTRTACCYPANGGFLAAHERLLDEALANVPEGEKVRVLFSAHGLPKQIVEAGDPYQFQVEETVRSLTERMGEKIADHVICYQSRVTPQEWIGPSTEDEIERAGQDRVHIVLVPIAFVSEHSETLIELDVEYRELAEEAGAPGFTRVPTLGEAPEYVRSLSEIVQGISRNSAGFSVMPPKGKRLCPPEFGDCPCRVAAMAESPGGEETAHG